MAVETITGYQPVADDFKFVVRDDCEIEDNEFAGESSYAKEVWRKFCVKKINVVALVILIIMIIMAIIGPKISGYVFDEQQLNMINYPPRVPILEKIGILDGTQVINKTMGPVISNPYIENNVTEYHLFGTDALGRDMFCRCFRGLRTSLIVAVLATLINVIIGVIYGMISGFFGGATDMVMQRTVEVLGSIPQMVILTLLVMILKPGMVTLLIAFMITGWMGVSQLVRAEVLRIKEMEFVMASRTLGAGGFFIVFRNILPNILGPVISQIMVLIPSTIFMESALSVMGLGISSGETSLGLLISGGLFTFFLHPHRLVFPIIIMVLTMVACNVLADGLRYAFDPKEVA